MDIFQEIKAHVSTIQAYQHYTGDLNKKGRIYWGLCPWHKEKTSSFAVYQDGGFKCYGCGIGGPDSIFFTARLFNLSMMAAAKKIIDDFSLPISLNDYRPTNKSNTDEVTYHDFITGLNQWRDKTFDNLCRLYRITKLVLSTLNMEDELFADMVVISSNLDMWTDTLIYGELIEIFQLYKQLKKYGWG